MNIVDSVIFVYTKHNIHMKEKKSLRMKMKKMVLVQFYAPNLEMLL
jgi:hypothetical protein